MVGSAWCELDDAGVFPWGFDFLLIFLGAITLGAAGLLMSIILRESRMFLVAASFSSAEKRLGSAVALSSSKLLD